MRKINYELHKMRKRNKRKIRNPILEREELSVLSLLEREGKRFQKMGIVRKKRKYIQNEVEDMKEIEINKEIYVLKKDIKDIKQSEPAKKLKGLEYKIIRGDRSGVFAGYLKSRKDREVVLLQARRIWYWEGASSLSQLAEEGTKKPDKCKFPKEVAEILILDAIEILSCTEEARKSIAGVPIWKQ